MAAYQAGSQERSQAERVALVSLIAALGLVAAKLAAGLASKSLALLSEAAHSGFDAAATALTYLAVRIGARPPDADHPYGHAKAENISALIEALILVALSVVIAGQAIRRLGGEASPVEATWYSFGVILLSIAVDISRSRLLRRAARRFRSPALEADALHFTTDLMTSVIVLVGLGFVAFGLPVADALGGLAIAVYVAFLSVRLGRRSIDALMDRAPAGAAERVGRAAAGVEGVGEVRRVRIRYAGGQPQADIQIALSRTLPLEIVYGVSEEVQRVIRAVEPGADVVVHVEPVADETAISQAVMSIAAREPSAHQVHNVFVASRPDGLHISLHAKFPGPMPLSEAHAIAERLEAEIAREIEGVARVDTHLEPLDASGTLGADVTERQSRLVAWASRLAEEQPEVEDCHEVVVTDCDGALSLVMHCAASPGLPVRAVHDASTRIETEVYRRWPEVERVTVHFEPLS